MSLEDDAAELARQHRKPAVEAAERREAAERERRADEARRARLGREFFALARSHGATVFTTSTGEVCVVASSWSRRRYSFGGYDSWAVTDRGVYYPRPHIRSRRGRFGRVTSVAAVAPRGHNLEAPPPRFATEAQLVAATAALLDPVPVRPEHPDVCTGVQKDGSIGYLPPAP